MKRNGSGRLWTLEGSPPAAQMATETFDLTEVSDFVTLALGPFHRTRAPTLKEGPFDMVFIDGHHDGDATLRYFDQLKPALSSRAVVLFDDVNWSAQMASAWQHLVRDPWVSHPTAMGNVGATIVMAPSVSRVHC